MYLQLYINGFLKCQWFFDDVDGTLADRQATEDRKREWSSRVAGCLEEAAKAIPDLSDCENVQMAWQVRSRIQPKDVPWEAYNAFTEQVTNNQVGRIIDKNRPKLENNKLK